MYGRSRKYGARKYTARKKYHTRKPGAYGAIRLLAESGDSAAAVVASRNATGQSCLRFHGGLGGAPFPTRYFHKLRFEAERLNGGYLGWTNGIGTGLGPDPSSIAAFANSPIEPYQTGQVAPTLWRTAYMDIIRSVYRNFLCNASRLTIKPMVYPNVGLDISLVLWCTVVPPTQWRTSGDPYVPGTLAGFDTWPNPHKIFKLTADSNYQDQTVSMFAKMSEVTSTVGDIPDYMGQYPSPSNIGGTQPNIPVYWGMSAFFWDGEVLPSPATRVFMYRIELDFYMESFNPWFADEMPVPPLQVPGGGEGEGDPLLEEDFEDMQLEVIYSCVKSITTSQVASTDSVPPAAPSATPATSAAASLLTLAKGKGSYLPTTLRLLPLPRSPRQELLRPRYNCPGRHRPTSCTAPLSYISVASLAGPLAPPSCATNRSGRGSR